MKLKQTLIAIVSIYLVALVGIFFFQRHILYIPDHVYVTPQEASVARSIQELSVKTGDGLDLKGWYAPATSKPFTFIFFHGNADSLRSIGFIGTPYIDLGYGFLAIEYRGYSGMPGEPTEQGLYADGRAFLRQLIAGGVKEKNIVLMGHSLGTGVATQMAHEFNVGGLILLAPYLSIPKIAQIRFPIFPVEYLAKDRYENFRKIPDIHTPLLVVNGGRDAIIPPSQGRKLFALANEPKQFYFDSERGHNDLLDGGFYAASLTWVKTLKE